MLNELLALVNVEFARARKQAEDSRDGMEKNARAGEALAYADVKMLIADLKHEHYSDCALHNAPALPIARCDCDGANVKLTSRPTGVMKDTPQMNDKSHTVGRSELSGRLERIVWQSGGCIMHLADQTKVVCFRLEDINRFASAIISNDFEEREKAAWLELRKNRERGCHPESL